MHLIPVLTTFKTIVHYRDVGNVTRAAYYLYEYTTLKGVVLEDCITMHCINELYVMILFLGNGYNVFVILYFSPNYWYPLVQQQGPLLGSTHRFSFLFELNKCQG